MNKVYLLWHVHEFEDENQDDCEKFIGAYACESDARAAIERLKDLPGFCYQPKGFQISPYRLGEDHWTEGYSTMTAIYVKDMLSSSDPYICVSAAIHPNGIYEICDKCISTDEKWEFSYGELVKCAEFEIEPGVKGILAVEKVDQNC